MHPKFILSITPLARSISSSMVCGLSHTVSTSQVIWMVPKRSRQSFRPYVPNTMTNVSNRSRSCLSDASIILSSARIGLGRGLNTVRLDVKTGQLVDQHVFDTDRSSDESNRLSEYLDQLPPDSVLFGISIDGFSARITNRLTQSLEALGLSPAGENNNNFRRNLAFASVVGRPSESIVRTSNDDDDGDDIVVINALIEFDPKTRAVRITERL